MPERASSFCIKISRNIDPCCGTGTLLIEAAFLASKRAPGLNRGFAMENWVMAEPGAFARIRSEAQALYQADARLELAGSDLDPDALALCGLHLKQAGLQNAIRVRQCDMREVRLKEEGICFLTNPPYGERMGDKKEAAQVAQALGTLLSAHRNATLCVITPDPAFEAHARHRAHKRRRLYNGRLECEFLVMSSQEG